MTYVLAYNPSDGPVLIDGQGRTVGGREWMAVDNTDPVAKLAFDSERLLQPEPPTKNADPHAVAAAKEAARLTARAKKLAALDKDVLLDAARTAGLVAEDDTPHKNDLVALLTRTDIDPPAKPAHTSEES